MARVGLADHGQKCPFMGVKRSRRLRGGNGVIDPTRTCSPRPPIRQLWRSIRKSLGLILRNRANSPYE